MTASMKRLAMLPGEGKMFFLSDWVKKEESSGWIFISCDADDRETLGSLMKFWTTLAMNALFKRGEDLNHRLWFIMDTSFSLWKGRLSAVFSGFSMKVASMADAACWVCKIWQMWKRFMA
jgi:hypothetical protein